MDLVDKTILLGVSGSIAAYKAAEICSRLGKLQADVHVVLTRHAAEFVAAPTFRALTRNAVLVDLFDEPQARRIAHIDVAQSADLVLLAPASANLLAKAAHGIADDMLTTCLLATPPTTPVLAAPAMNTVMWDHPATRANVELLRSRGVEIIAPAYGLLACQDLGHGKLAEVDEIVAAVVSRLSGGSLSGRRILVTAGATREPLDPVRFLTNRSSGKMGYAVAAEARRRGAHVTLVSGFATAEPPPGVEVVRVGTAHEMLAACEARFPACDVAIAAAAVADYAPVSVAPQKLKKSAGQEELTLRLRRTPDVVAALGATKRPGQLVVGFAAETEELIANARTKFAAKHLDLIVANDVAAEGAGFEVDTNAVTLLWPDGRCEPVPLAPKPRIAARILGAVQEMLAPPPAKA